MQQLLTLRTVADRTETSVAYWRKAVARRAIAATKIGRAVRIAEADLHLYLSQRVRPAREVAR
jgi:excisionase family DNA binding protein